MKTLKKKTGRGPSQPDLARFPITPGIPLPDRAWRFGRVEGSKNVGYPFELLNPGDSFLFGEYTAAKMTSACSQGCRAAGITGYDYAVRKVEENGQEMVRVWRIDKTKWAGSKVNNGRGTGPSQKKG